jgi:hypothetical protein
MSGGYHVLYVSHQAKLPNRTQEEKSEKKISNRLIKWWVKMYFFSFFQFFFEEWI